MALRSADLAHGLHLQGAGHGHQGWGSILQSQEGTRSQKERLLRQPDAPPIGQEAGLEIDEEELPMQKMHLAHQLGSPR